MNLQTLESLPLELRHLIVHRDLEAQENLFQQGDEATAFYVVETGRLKLVRYSSNGKEVTFPIARAGEIIAEIALFSNTYPCAVVAEVASRVIVYPKQAILSALRDNSDLAEDFMAMLVRKIHDLKVRLELRDIRAAHERVLRYLRYMAQLDEQTTVTFDRPLKDIALDLGLTPETLSRALTRLEREGMITRTKLQIKL
ncbi:MAG: Crp/Fnr family transcriptional regulator [Pelatocladus maniniholoensis HA4357-MV3]|jgi:CRP-like cAMP-binding protein|uniref:Crp/Fnr family transcriptional regulator n=1 Tax=Pelatocladus maniniholoensis HA4357-MV3 TaxID=1117104 RepID=A0A9E3LRK6_9NOST|nr:Crp/Fnr family transcriptional regulator [Pelatocladus maniniholoensis HA4357-MV3]BAZ65509.1 Crp/Fnr family transcriptional regulator [Fischerella sp. NIES-4106]